MLKIMIWGIQIWDIFPRRFNKDFLNENEEQIRRNYNTNNISNEYNRRQINDNNNYQEIEDNNNTINNYRTINNN